MKVAIVQKDLKNLRSGVSRLVRSELEALDEVGHESFLISEKVKPIAYSHTSAQVRKTFRWPFKGAIRRRFFKWQTEYWLGRIAPDVSIAHGDIASADVCFIHNCVHFEHELIHGVPLPSDNDVGALHTEVLTKQQFQVLVCNSELMKQDLVQRFHIRDKHIEVLYPSCDPDNVTRPERDMRAELGMTGADLVIGLITSGNFKKRNVQLFLEASAQLRSEQRLHIVVAGNGKASEFQNLLEQHPHTVHFLPSTDCVADYYAMLDVFVLPAFIEEFGMSALEAMTCSKPVVLHNMVGASEILEGESVSFSISGLDQQVWTNALQALCDDAGLRKRLGAQNAETAKKYTASQQNKKFLELISRFQENS
ncbi:hypothetical protein A3765_01845 [Oleiphilus sp. HI0130]|nr:hypothetical protein A3765_01845 [Oleiphilus sp. HI0130]KZZ81519.1 hypothetical protein A3767_07820 [Oleiphilus sp. HI0133]